MTRRRKLRVKLSLALFALLLALPPAGLYYSGSLLCVDLQPVPESLDAIVVLGGDYPRRATRAAELFRAHPVDRVFVVGDGDAGAVRIYLKAKGVPGERIAVEPESRNTMQNARLGVPLLRQAGVKRAAIVTSWFHSRRALACFRKVAPDLEFVSFPTVVDRPVNHWPPKYERGAVLSEYVKITGYILRHGIWPF